MADKQRQSDKMPFDKMQIDRLSDTSNRCAKAPLPPEIQGVIGAKLRQIYGELLSEPLPRKFQSLLDEFGKSDPKR